MNGSFCFVVPLKLDLVWHQLRCPAGVFWCASGARQARSANGAARAVVLGREFELRPDEQARLMRTKLRITFMNVKDDIALSEGCDLRLGGKRDGASFGSPTAGGREVT